MSRLDELIQKFCPNGVEFVKIKEVFPRLKGTPITAGKMKEIENSAGEIKIFAGGKTVISAKEIDIPKANIIRVPAVLVQSRGVIDVIYYDKPFTFKNEMWAYTADNPSKVKYLYYILKNNIQAFRAAASGMGSLPQISLSVTEDLHIPLPPLPIQQEIVRILDTFTNLTAELTAELTARRKQYEYYRDELLTFGEDVPKLCLSEIATEMYRGSGIKRDEVSESGIPCVRYGEIYTTYDVQFNKCVSHVDPKKVSAPKYFEYGDVLFAITGESVSDIAKSVVYLGSDICLAGGDIVVMKHKQNPRYMAYALSTTNAQIQKSKGKVKSKVVHSSMPSLREIRIPIPSLIEQEKIANILDNFRKLCNGFDEGLPAEISARQKQYEYYRNKLLQFSV